MHDLFQLLIAQPIFNALMFLYSIIPWHDFGLAIIIFTILMRFAMYPLVKSQLRQTKLMRKMQPELARIKKNAKGNRQVEALQQMELYKRYGIKPMRSILILLIQLPIFIGLYQVINIIISLNSTTISQYLYEPIKNMGVIQSIIQDPSNFNHTMLGFIDLTKTTFQNGSVDFVLLILAAISAVTQYLIIRQTSPTTGNQKRFRDLMRDAAAGKEADPTEMSGVMTRGMMKFMPIMMFLIMISLPGALALYYTASNLVAAAQQHFLLKRDADELHDIAEEVVEAPRPKKSSKKSREKKAKEANITRIKAK